MFEEIIGGWTCDVCERDISMVDLEESIRVWDQSSNERCGHSLRLARVVILVGRRGGDDVGDLVSWL